MYVNQEVVHLPQHIKFKGVAEGLDGGLHQVLLNMMFCPIRIKFNSNLAYIGQENDNDGKG